MATTLLVLTALLAPACSNRKASSSAPPRKEATAFPVAAAAVIRKSLPIELPGVGTVEAYATVGVKSQVSGQLREVHFTEGEEVHRGELLFTIDPQPFENTLQQAEATLARDLAYMANARKQAARSEDLLSKGMVSPADAEELRTTATGFESSVAVDRAAVENARLQLGYCSITAPISGRTGSLIVDPGNLVKENADTPLVTINQIQPINVLFPLPEEYLGKVLRLVAGTEAIKVTALIVGDEEIPEEGTLKFVDNAVDRANGAILLRAFFPNANRRLWPGQFVSVELELGALENALVLPSSAVLSGQNGQYVYVIKDDSTVESRPVTGVKMFGQEAAVSGGVEAGERIVTDGQLRLFSGALVQIKTAEKTAS